MTSEKNTETLNFDELVKSTPTRHSRAGVNPEHTEMLGLFFGKIFILFADFREFFDRFQRRNDVKI